MKMTNRWNRFIYRLWAPVYDVTVGHLFLPGRMRAIELLDLSLASVSCWWAWARALTCRSCLKEYRYRGGYQFRYARSSAAQASTARVGCALVQGDAQGLLVEEASCDAAVFNLILSVIPDGAACLRENLRPLNRAGTWLSSINSCLIPEG